MVSLSVGTTRTVKRFDSATSTFASPGGKLISMVCGFAIVVVNMKNVNSRKATSTMGVISMRTPIRRRFFLECFCFPRDSDACTSAMIDILLQLFCLIRDKVEACDIDLLKKGHHAFHDIVFGVLVRFDHCSQFRVHGSGADEQLSQVIDVRLHFHAGTKP